jgi:hypothetical protein
MVCKVKFAEDGYLETENCKFSLHLANFSGFQKIAWDSNFDPLFGYLRG